MAVLHNASTEGHYFEGKRLKTVITPFMYLLETKFHENVSVISVHPIAFFSFFNGLGWKRMTASLEATNSNTAFELIEWRQMLILPCYLDERRLIQCIASAFTEGRQISVLPSALIERRQIPASPPGRQCNHCAETAMGQDDARLTTLRWLFNELFKVASWKRLIPLTWCVYAAQKGNGKSNAVALRTLSMNTA